MKASYSHILFVLILSLVMVGCENPIDNIQNSDWVEFTSPAKGFSICSGSKVADIYIDTADYAGVQKVAKLFVTDIHKVTGKVPVLKFNNTPEGIPIVVGTIGKSHLIQDLIEKGKLNVDDVKGKWENSLVAVIEHPWPNVDQVLVIAGSDKRGTIYGMFEISRKIGVSPWYWWADVPVKKHQEIYITKGRYNLGEPKVKYRGIFLNDEEPALGRWAVENYGGFNHQFYEKVFELLLRQKANFLWPAMWWASFGSDDLKNAQLADEMGIVMSTSHHEPMMRAHAEWKKYGGGDWNYKTNAKQLKEFWRSGIERMGDKESIVTLAMRGDGDEAMEEGTNIELLEQIVSDQRQIIEEVTQKPAIETPQVWALYKEVQDYYNKGMQVPDDVTLLLCDDNWGNVRVLPDTNAPQRAGGYGMYYHFDFVGGPRSYKWLNTVQVSRIWEQMGLTYEHGVDRIWIVNVGDLKPMELPISFFLDYAWNPESIGIEQLEQYTNKWAAEQFGPEHAQTIGEILDLYTQYNSRRKPESLSPETYSLDHYNEFKKVVDDYKTLYSKSDSIYKLIEPSQKDAYYQLVYFPVATSSNLYELYYTVALNHQYAKQGSSRANEMADKARLLFERDSILTNEYHTKLAGGKWNHMMAQTHIGYTSWNEPKKNIMSELMSVEVKAEGKVNIPIAVEADFDHHKNDKLEGFIERNGVVSMEAIHFTGQQFLSVGKWAIVKGLGRTEGAVIAQPRVRKIKQINDTSPHLEYKFTLLDEPKNDSIEVQAYLSPILNYEGGDGLCFGVSIDNEKPQIINIHKGCEQPDWEYPSWWNNAVLDNVMIRTSKHKIKGIGQHVLRFWLVDSGVVLQKIVVDNGGLKPSYLGPPESVFIDSETLR